MVVGMRTGRADQLIIRPSKKRLQARDLKVEVGAPLDISPPSTTWALIRSAPANADPVYVVWNTPEASVVPDASPNWPRGLPRC